MDLNTLLSITICPSCKGKLEIVSSNKELICKCCKNKYEIVNGVPVLLDNDSKKDFQRFFANNSENDCKPTNQELSDLKIQLPINLSERLFDWFKQAPATKIGDKRIKNINKIQSLFLKNINNPNILIIGSFLPQDGKNSSEVEELQNSFKDSIRLDISFRSGVNIIGDGHKLPFEDNSFDAVIAQAVIKHLRDPNKFVEEVHRVLKKEGIVYAECPFLITFHRWPGDYVRYSPAGFRELFKDFQIIETGFNRGPSQTIADLLSIYFACLLSFNNRYVYLGLVKFFSWIFHPIKLLDYYLIHIKWADLLIWVNYIICKKNDD